MRKRLPLVALLAALAFPSSALAANQTVTTTAADQFSPATVTVSPGETVTWNNTSGGQHNVHFDDGSFVEPPMASTMMWSVSRTFNTVGFFRYYCEIHGAPGGQGMAGTVVVSTAPPGTTPPPGGTSPGGNTSPLYADSAPPKLALASSKAQRVVKQRGVILRVKSDEAATLRARATVSVPGASKVLKFKSAKTKLPAGTERKVKLNLSRAALRSVKRAMKRGKRLVARVAVSAKDKAGNEKTGTQKIRLKA
jgi:plastocyanin